MSKFSRKLSYKIYYFFIGQRIQKGGKIINGKRVFYISDMHFGHANMLKWCRGDCFRNLHEMHAKLISNWNYIVGKYDRVYCLGDFGLFRYKKFLNGRITIAKGNHDQKQWDRQFTMKYRDLKFLVVHNPDDNTRWFNDGWIIHGHTHVNTPFIDIHRKRVNVSCEMINYTPITMEKIYSIIKESVNYRDNRWYL